MGGLCAGADARARRRRTAAPAVGCGPPRPSAAGVRHRCRPARRAGTHGLGRRLAALVLPRSAVFLPGAASHRAARQRRPGAGRDRCAELPVAVRTGLGRSDHAAPRPGQSLEPCCPRPNCCAAARAGTAIAGRPCARRMRCPCRTPRAGWARRIPCWRWRHEGPDKRDGGLRAARRAQWRLPGRRRAAAGRGWPDGLARMERPGPAPRGRVHGGQPGAAPPPAGTRAAPQAGAIARGARDRGPAVAPTGRGPAAAGYPARGREGLVAARGHAGAEAGGGRKSARVEMLVASERGLRLRSAPERAARLYAVVERHGLRPGDPNRAIVVSIFVEVR